MPAHLRGFNGPLQQSAEWIFDPSNGYTYDQVFKSFNYEAMTALANRFNFYGINTRLKFEHGVATLITTDATGTVTIDKWEIAIDREQPSVFENPIFQTALTFAADSSAVVSLLKSAIQSNQLWEDLRTSVEWADAVGGGDEGLFEAYFNDYNNGVTNYLREKYVLRHTTNAPNRWNVNIADVNAATIYSISQLLSEVQNPSLWVFPLPGYLAFKILTYPIPAAQTNYFYGALKCRSNAVTCANSRVDITTEYIIDSINTNLYPFAS